MPLDAIGPIESGDVILAKMVDPERRSPSSGHGGADGTPGTRYLGCQRRARGRDPAGDDHGPGSYTYPTDPVFVPGSYDLTNFEIGIEGDDAVVTFDVAARPEPMGSPRGCRHRHSISNRLRSRRGDREQDTPSGRNAALPEGYGWEQALTVEGWEPALYLASRTGAAEETRPFEVTVFSEEGRVVARLPANSSRRRPGIVGLHGRLAQPGGFPSPGVRQVRDVGGAAAIPDRWRRRWRQRHPDPRPGGFCNKASRKMGLTADAVSTGWTTPDRRSTRVGPGDRSGNAATRRVPGLARRSAKKPVRSSSIGLEDPGDEFDVVVGAGGPGGCCRGSNRRLP